MGLWSFLRGLWPWRTRPRPEPFPRPAPLAEPEALPLEEPAAPPPPEPAPPEPVAPEEEASAPPPELEFEPETEQEPDSEELDEDEDEDAGWEDEEVDDPDAPDPFITGSQAEDEADGADLAERRAAARAMALLGEQRIYLSMPAGPGSLAEALEQLAAEGLVTAEFVSEGEDAPHILYRPVDGGDGTASTVTSPEDQ
jgi:hypothetical protein